MAKRNIRVDGDEVLRKKCRPVEEIDEKIITLLKDMAETMYDANGVGLAGPQVGILKRVAVIDIGEGLIELINPKIINSSGEKTDIEGCLSIPGVWGEVKRPKEVTVEAMNSKGEKCIIEGKDLLATALCHEIDHLDGVLFTDKVIKYVSMEDLDKR